MLGDARGVVYLEFLLCFLPVFLIFLGCVQLAFIHVAKLTVKFAASRGARSAAVVLADDPYFYEGEAVGLLVAEDNQSGGGDSGDSAKSGIVETLGLGDALALWDSEEGSARMADIRAAVHMPLTALSPNAETVGALVSGEDGAERLDQAIGSEHLSRLATGLLFYNDAVTAIRFPKTPHGDDFHEGKVSPDGDTLTVRVTHLFHCQVPLVSALICRSTRSMGLDYLAQAAFSDEDENDQDEEEDEDPDKALWEDLDNMPSRTGLTAVMASAMRVFVLREEATVASQWAPYEFRSLDDED